MIGQCKRMQRVVQSLIGILTDLLALTEAPIIITVSKEINWDET